MTPVVTDRIKAFPSGSFLCRAQPERNAVRRGERRRHLLAEAGLHRRPETRRKGVGAESEGAPRSQGPGRAGGGWVFVRDLRVLGASGGGPGLLGVQRPGGTPEIQSEGISVSSRLAWSTQCALVSNKN